MKKLFRIVGWVLAILAGLVGITALVSLTGVDLQPLTTPVGKLPVAAHADTRLQGLRAGLGRAKLTPTVGASNDVPEKGEFRSLPLAGFGNRQGKPAQGVHDDVWVKAMAFAVGGRTGVVVCADALIVPREIAELAAQRLKAEAGLEREQIYFSATHTHCSLGGWGEGVVGEAFAGPFQPAVRTWFAQQLVVAAEAALADLKPASLGTDFFSEPKFIRNRLVGERGQVDPEFALLVVKQTEGKTGVLGSYGAHPTTLGGGMMQFSAEYPGVWQRTVEEATGGLAMFAAGGIGSHGPRAPQGGLVGVEQMGRALAEETLQRLPSIALTNQVRFDLLGITVPLPELQARITDAIRVRPWLAAKFVPVGESTFLQGFRFNDTLWMSTPCDFSGELALELKAEGRAKGLRLQMTSFNGDYVGYVIPSKYYHLDGYEPRTMSFFGPHLPDLFMDTLRQIRDGLAQ